MTPGETARVLAVLTAAYPNVTLEEPTVRLWAQQLADVAAKDAQAVATSIIRTDQWFPTLARFFEVWREHRRLERMRETNPALPAAPASPPLAKERIAEIREQLSKVGKGRA